MASLAPDHRLPGLLGYEIDRAFPDGPAKLEILAPFSPPAGWTGRVWRYDLYQARSGAHVFATGTIQWSWGLDDYNAPALRTARTSEAAQQITRNILELLAPEDLSAAQ
ncbi:MAG: hypothetical protein IPO99_10205 [Nitrospira sp.]|nr:hypothetical protein [Nitrospira sp.]